MVLAITSPNYSGIPLNFHLFSTFYPHKTEESVKVDKIVTFFLLFIYIEYNYILVEFCLLLQNFVGGIC